MSYDNQPPTGEHPQYPFRGEARRPPRRERDTTLWILIAVLIGAVLLCCGGGGIFLSVGSNDEGQKPLAPSGATSSPTTNPGRTAAATRVGTKRHPAPRGTAVRNQSDSYKIDDVDVTHSLGSFIDPPQGVYVVVTVTVENVTNSTLQINSGDFTLEVNGTEVDAADTAVLMDGAFGYDDALSPHLKRTGKIAFDVRPADAGMGKLKAQAEFGTDDPVYMSLN